MSAKQTLRQEVLLVTQEALHSDERMGLIRRGDNTVFLNLWRLNIGPKYMKIVR